MNFLQMRQRAARLASVAGAMDLQPQADFSDLVLQALAEFSWETEWNTETTTFQTVINQQAYVIGLPAWKYFFYCVWGTTQSLIQTTEEEMQRRDNLWLVNPGGQPIYFWQGDPYTLMMYPTPTTGGITITARGVREAPALVQDTDVAPFPQTYHACIAYRAAHQALDMLERTETVLALMSKYEERWNNDVTRCKEWITDDDAEMQRVVKPRTLGRIPLGAYTIIRGPRW